MNKSKEMSLQDSLRNAEKHLTAQCGAGGYSATHNFLVRFIYISGLAIGLAACSLEVSLHQPLQNGNTVAPSHRKDPDFIHGERVTTTAGHQITGVFGETSEKKKALNSNHWEFEEVFYE